MAHCRLDIPDRARHVLISVSVQRHRRPDILCSWWMHVVTIVGRAGIAGWGALSHPRCSTQASHMGYGVWDELDGFSTGDWVVNFVVRLTLVDG